MTSRDEYQRKRAESYKRFSGAIVQYQALAGLFGKKKYLQYFLTDTAIISVLRKVFEKQKEKKLQECTEQELSGQQITDFINNLQDSEVLEQYQLHYGPVGSEEYIAARALFTRKAQCTFEMSLADTALELVKTIQKPASKLLSWSEEFTRPQLKDHGLFEEEKTQAVYIDDALTKDDFQSFGDVIPQQTTTVLDGSLIEDHHETVPDQLEVSEDRPCHYAVIASIEERDLREKRVEKLEHAAKLRKVVLDKINVDVPQPVITQRDDYSESVTKLINGRFELGIYAPTQSGKNVYLKGRRHQLLSTDEFYYQSYENVKVVAQRGIITSDVDLAAKARISLAIVPTWDVFRYRHFKTRLKTSERHYQELLNRLGRYDYVFLTNKYVSQAMAEFE